jgi:hypothetical protein
MMQVTKVWWDGERLMAEPIDPAAIYKDGEPHQCKYPTCQNEEYQQAMAEQIKQELYTGKPWVGLTDDEVAHIADSEWEEAFVRLIEAKLKEKNNAT